MFHTFEHVLDIEWTGFTPTTRHEAFIQPTINTTQPQAPSSDASAIGNLIPDYSAIKRSVDIESILIDAPRQVNN